MATDYYVAMLTRDGTGFEHDASIAYTTSSVAILAAEQLITIWNKSDHELCMLLGKCRNYRHGLVYFCYSIDFEFLSGRYSYYWIAIDQDYSFTLQITRMGICSTILMLKLFEVGNYLNK